MSRVIRACVWNQKRVVPPTRVVRVIPSVSCLRGLHRRRAHLREQSTHGPRSDATAPAAAQPTAAPAFPARMRALRVIYIVNHRVGALFGAHPHP